MRILDTITIDRKIRRMAIQIIENNYKEKEIYLVGINHNGSRLAELIQKEFKAFSDIESHLLTLTINVKSPLTEEISINTDVKNLKNKVVVIIDDVVNTGRTLFYGFQPLMEILPKRVESAALINRKHKSYPVNVDYIGLSLATTVQDDIRVILEPKKDMEAILI